MRIARHAGGEHARTISEAREPVCAETATEVARTGTQPQLPVLPLGAGARVTMSWKFAGGGIDGHQRRIVMIVERDHTDQIGEPEPRRAPALPSQSALNHRRSSRGQVYRSSDRRTHRVK